MRQLHFWEANRFSASPRNSHILWNLKIHHCIYKCLPPLPVLSHINPVHSRPTHFPKIHLNGIFPCTHASSKWSLSLRFPHQKPYTPLLSPICATCPSHPILLYLITQKIFLLVLIYLFLFSFSIATSPWKELDSGTSGSVVRISVCLTSLTTRTFCSQEKWFLNPDKILWESVTKYPSFFTILFWGW